MLYRSPELFDVRTHADLDEKTDIFSLGCILYFMAYGEGPFEKAQLNGDSLVLATANESYSFPESDNHFGIHDLIKSMLSSDPKKRPNIQDICHLVHDSIKT